MKITLEKSTSMSSLKNLVNMDVTITSITEGEPWKIEKKEYRKLDLVIDGENYGISHGALRLCTVRGEKLPVTDNDEITLPATAKAKVILVLKGEYPKYVLQFDEEVSSFK